MKTKPKGNNGNVIINEEASRLLLPLPMVDVIIPAYNYASKIHRAIESVKEQTLSNFACFIVDDGSTDNTEDVVRELIKDDLRFNYIKQDNRGVANARNRGVFSGKGKYVCCLDADDAITSRFLETCVDYLEANQEISIAYTGLWYIKPNGEQGLSKWPEEFNYDSALEGHNQIPTCNVARREVWERLGGQRQRYAPDGAGEEDAELWLRAGAYGFRAKKVTDAGMFLYSWMSGGVSGNKNHKITDYRFYHPWVTDKRHPFPSLAKPEKFSHPVRQYDEPMISVIIPVGPGHSEYIIDALDSLEAQTFRNWEAIIVDDTRSDESIDLKKIIDLTYPYVRYYKNEGNTGAGASRNVGANNSRAPFVVFLDADDWLHPDALETMLFYWEQSNSIIYTDHFGKAILTKKEAEGLGNRLISHNEKTGVALFLHGWLPFNCLSAQSQPNQDMYHWCVITTLIPKVWHDEIGGFDEIMESWEDWDYFIRMAKLGKCFYRVAEPLFVYRYYTGRRREGGLRDRQKLIKYMQDKYEGLTNMPCKSCGQSTNVPNPRPSEIKSSERIMTSSDEEFVLTLYLHPNRGQHHVIGGATGFNYGYRAGGDKFLVHVRDIVSQPNLFQRITVSIPKEVKVEPPKPKAIEVVNEESEEDFDLQKIAGVSGSIAQNLNAAGIHSVRELANIDKNLLMQIKGIAERRADAIIASANLELKKENAESHI